MEAACPEPRFVAKSANVSGLQISDLVARPIGRHILDPHRKGRAHEALEWKLDTSA